MRDVAGGACYAGGRMSKPLSRPGPGVERTTRGGCGGAGRLLAACALAAGWASADPAADLRAVAGARVRVAWVQDQGDGSDTFAAGDRLKLMAFDTGDARGERAVLNLTGRYHAPVLTPRGDRILFSDLQAGRTWVVNWGGDGLRDVTAGKALDAWVDEAGDEWVYVGRGSAVGKGDTYAEVHRVCIDRPEREALMWNRAPVSADGFLVSRDGAWASGLFPWPHASRIEMPNRGRQPLAGGCWTALSPDDSRVLWVFDGAHRNLTMYPERGDPWKVGVNAAPALDGFEVYHPRWSNHTRFLALTGPYKVGSGGNRIRGGGPGVEVFVGRFSADLSRVERWVQVTHNDRADFFPDAWIEGGATSRVTRAGAVPTAAAPRYDASRHTAWPGSTDGLVFLWENRRSANEVADATGGVVRTCRVNERGAARYGRYGQMLLTGGAVRAEAVDEPLLTACRASSQLTIECTLSADTLDQRGLARVVTFSKDASRRNVTLGQEGDRLVLRLRTPATGANGVNPQVELCRIAAGRPVHTVVTYRPGDLRVYTNGVEAVATRAVTGNLGNWEPAHLLFGDEWTGDRDWAGELEGVAIYSRCLSAEEARHHYELFAPRLRGREPLPQIEVEARLRTLEATPAPADIAPYRRCLAVGLYDVVRVTSGRVEGRALAVAHWVMLDANPLDPPCVPGQTAHLVLERYDAHPELAGERLMEPGDPDYLEMTLFLDARPPKMR